MKRLAAIFVILGLLTVLFAVPAASASSLAFVAVNDTIPLTLSGSSMPFYSGGDLYVPYTAFDVSSLGFYPSYNSSSKTMTLFSRSSRLVYDLAGGYVTDEENVVSEVGAISSGGMIFLPASFSASHFGVSVSFLTSKSGYLVVRFTTGDQVYDDDLFLEKANNLIEYRVSQAQSSGGTTSSPPTPPASPSGSHETGTAATETETETDRQEPATILLAVTGGGDLAASAALLDRYGIKAAFFLTADEIAAGGDAIRQITASGHTIGLAASSSGGDMTAQLDRANQALLRVLGRKTLLALVPENARVQENSWCLFRFPETPVTAAEAADAHGERRLLLCTGDTLASSLAALQSAGCVYEHIGETTLAP